MGKSFLDEDGYLHKKRPHTKLLATLERELVEPTYITDAELQAAKGDVCVFDLEIYPNYFLAAFEHVKSGKVATFELAPNRPVFDAHKLLWVMHNFCIVGFNSMKFDIPIIWLALQGASLEQLNDAVEQIITFNLMPRDIENRFLFKIGQTNHVDLIEVAPLSASLKVYGGRLGTSRLQDLPFAPEKRLTSQQMRQVMLYCVNDLALTKDLLFELEPQLNLRHSMSLEYGVDLRSKSDAQIAEAVINSEIQKLSGFYPKKAKLPENFTIKYNVPDFIKFETVELNNILKKLSEAKFSLDGFGSPVWPEGLGVKEKSKDGKDKWVLRTIIGKGVYKIAMGGLHSSEKNVAHIVSEGIEIADNDVESFYPRIILNQLLAPEHLKEWFIEVYNYIVERRLEAKALAKKYKKEGNREKSEYYKTIADSLKIVINGSFGKLGNKYSRLYAPQLMLQVTITGQLVLLMLIERLEQIGIEVISGNTDGFISKYQVTRRNEVRKIIKQWEIETNFKTEETKYLAVFSKDVNNYFAIKEEGGDKEARYLDEQLGIKVKGVFCERGSALNSVLSKNPELLICSDAIMNLIAKNIPVEDTIINCKDIKRFTTIRTVKGGGEQDGVYLGKVVRWYYSTETKGRTINYVLSGNKVPKSEGAKPCMDLPPAFPTDIDYDWYINETISMLYDIGYYKKPTQQMFF